MKEIKEILGTLALAAGLVVVSILLIGALRAMGKAQCPPEGMVLLRQETVDSLRAEANRPPEIVVKDSIIRVDSIIYVYLNNPKPIIDTNDPGINNYRDSVVNDSVNVWVDVMTRGTVEELTIGYKPVIQYKEITITKHLPVPIIEKERVPVNAKGVVVQGGIGYMFNQPLLLGEISWMNGCAWTYGVQYMRSPDSWGVAIKGGYKFNIKP